MNIKSSTNSINFSNCFIDTVCVFTAVILFYLSSPNCFASQGYPIFAWVFAVPLFFVFDGKGVCKRLLFGIMFSLITYALILSWIININIFLFVFFVFLFAVQTILFAVFFKTNRSNKIINIFFIPALWVMTEAVRSFLIGGYAWTIGHSQAFIPTIIQIADITGAHGISFVILLVNTCLYYAITDRRRARIYLMIGAGFVAVTLLYGKATIKDMSSESRQGYSICTIQPNISSEEKLNPDLIDVVVDKQLVLTERCFENKMPDLIVWPETAITDDILRDEILNQKMQSFIKKNRVKMLIGSALLVDGKSYNSAVLFGKAGETQGVYHKQHLLPFNEYFPLQDKLLFLRKIFNLNNYDFREGKKGAEVLPIYEKPHQGYFGVAICSEEGYPELLRREVSSGAEFIVAMLNDAWFKSDAAVMMHAQNGFMQAATFKVPVIRSTNSGLSCAIDKYGRAQRDVRADLRLDSQAVFHFNIDRSQQRTFYAKFGNVFVFVCSLFSIMILCVRFSKWMPANKE